MHKFWRWLIGGPEMFPVQSRVFPSCTTECQALYNLKAAMLEELRIIRAEQSHGHAQYTLVRTELAAYHEIVMQAINLDLTTRTDR